MLERTLQSPRLAALWEYPWIDEALVRRELRRMARWVRAGRLPVLYFAATVLLPWLVAPGFLYFSVAGQRVLDRQGWLLTSFLVAAVLLGMVVAFARSSQLWWSERNGDTLADLLISQQAPAAVVSTATGTAMLLAATLSIPAALLAGCTLLTTRPEAGREIAALLLSLLLGGLGAALAASLAAALFFLVHKTRPVRPVTVTAVLFAVIALALWLWLETLEGGWRRPWEEHSGRALFALVALTPVPHLCGVMWPDWWRAEVAARLPSHPSALLTSLLLALLYLAGAALLHAAARQGFRRLRAEPELLERVPKADEEEAVPGAPYEYWRGFRNPVWTREIRTRLRSRESAEVLFFASIAIAAAGFIPLLVAAGQLTDPLRSASVAREVFFWLAMTLGAFLTLLTPGLTAESVGLERARNTLELLVATPMRAGEILRGKLLGAASIVLLLLSPSLPLFALCTLFHGASLGQVVGLYLVLALHLVVCTAFGITASAMHPRLFPAKVQAYALAFVAACLPGGALWVVAALAMPSATGRADFQWVWTLAPGLLTFALAVLRWQWGLATERLEFAEWEP
jgi:hypothetical protein